MGKLIQFPIGRLHQHRSTTANVFSAFGELESLERVQMRFIAGSAAVALLLTFALQLMLG